MQRWSIYIDIEGFSSRYDAQPSSLHALSAIMEGIFFIGRRCYPEPDDRLFAHQLGDGFIISGDFGRESLAQPVAVAVALMRHALLGGGAARAAISEGELADVVACYPKIVYDAMDANHHGAVRLGAGLMTLFPVMGTGLINAYRLLDRCRDAKGSLLLLDRSMRAQLPSGVPVRELESALSLDWLHADFSELRRVNEQARFPQGDFESRLRGYVGSTSPSDAWVTGTYASLALA
ncbi:MAG: hypothetical protein EXS13_03375 [Planctomycetes bacterium]|nr:hypothetical protein [Planctomycetota bacterium]